MKEKLKKIEDKFQKLTDALSDPEVVKNPNELKRIGKERAQLEPVVEVYHELKKQDELAEQARSLVGDKDSEIVSMAKEELAETEKKLGPLKAKIMELLTPKDPRDSRGVIVEIRAGTGGDEAGLFAAVLFRMYSKYAEKMRYKIELMNSNVTGVGGFKEVIATIEGDHAYSKFKYESGVHRVQRVPTTESQGRIHTSTATVAVLPVADEVEVNIEEKDIKVDVFRSSGPGGQSVNTTDSAVRITHVPTGMIVTCQDEKSQHKNKAKALKVLRARLFDLETSKQQGEVSDERRKQVGSGDRSEKIRTYNYPQGRITDHRIGYSVHKFQDFLDGSLDELLDALSAHFNAEAAIKENPIGSSAATSGNIPNGRA